MGCGSSNTVATHNNPEFHQIQQTWDEAHGTLEVKLGKRFEAKKLVVKRSGWKTIRIFVSSTFKDFHAEREVLVKKVFPDLRVWCEQRRLQLIDCDLRWGVPADVNVEFTLRACLGEIDRCYQDNVMPYFVNMTSERIGWIPVGTEIPEAVRDEYKWVDGLSVTEMEIMHGAYRNDNPNAVFLLRKSNFLDGVPEEERGLFVDSNPIASNKLGMLKKMIQKRFPKGRTFEYEVEYQGFDTETKTPRLAGLDGTFSQTVFNFFKSRIEEQYPLPDEHLDPYHQILEQHESFMKNRAASVLGRDALITQIDDYIQGVGNSVPFVLIGSAGSGKSSLMAKVADRTATSALQGKIPGGGNQGWLVFYHFVGAVPGSTELEMMLKRLLKEMGICSEDDMPKSLEDASIRACGALNNPASRPTIIIVDALNQFDEDEAAQLVNWVPRKLAPHIRCVFSMIPDTPQHKVFTTREPLPQITELGPLDNEAKMAIVESMLGRYNKHLDNQQMSSLLGKSSSENPLWLSIACEELRVFGQYRQVSDKINTLPDGLLELEMDVLSRFERENGGELLVGALCLLEVSQRGLLEVELVTILGDEENLFPGNKTQDTQSEKKDEEKKEKATKLERLPAYKWAEVYRALKPFLRPFGDSGEGRLDFYHRSLSKAVRRKYFMDSDGNNKEEVYRWWHLELADFFEHINKISRKLEEYPYHLLAVKDQARMAAFLTDWDIIDQLYNEELSSKLLYFWRMSSSYDDMAVKYNELMSNLENTAEMDPNILEKRYEQMARIMGQGGKHDDSKKMCERAMDLETTKLGERDEQMARLLYLVGFVEDQILKADPFCDDNQKPSMRLIISSFEKASAILEKDRKPDNDGKTQMARLKNRTAFYYGSLARLGGDEDLPTAECSKKAMEIIDEAIAIFEDLGDEINVADSLITKGTCYLDAVPEQLKAYEEAMGILKPKVGNIHLSMRRCIQNLSVYYEDIKDYENSFIWLWKWYENSCEMYGQDHPATNACLECLREPFYVRMAKKKGFPVP